MPFFNIVAATNEDTVVSTYDPSKVRSDCYQSEAELEKELYDCCVSKAIPTCHYIQKMNWLQTCALVWKN